MLLEIFDIEPFKNFFDLIYDSAQIVELKVGSENLSISLLNNSHIAFYNVVFDKAFFGEYGFRESERVLVFVEDLYKILKSSHKDDTLLLETNDSNLICVFEHDGNRRVFELPLAEDYGDTPIPPSIEYPTEVTLNVLDLKQPCTDLDKIIKTDRFKIVLDGEEFNVVAPSDAMTKYQNTIIVDNDYDGSLSSIYNIQYISDLLKLSKISKSVLLKIGDGVPLTWIMKSSDDLIEVSGLVAPIIEDS